MNSTDIYGSSSGGRCNSAGLGPGRGRGEPPKETAEQIASVNAQADAAGRPHPRIGVSFRPIVAPTDELAREKAHQILAQTKANIAVNGNGRRRPPVTPQNVGSRRLLKVAERGNFTTAPCGRR